MREFHLLQLLGHLAMEEGTSQERVSCMLIRGFSESEIKSEILKEN